MFSPWLWHKETAESTRRAVKDKLAERFVELDHLLSQQAFLAGEFSVADAYAFTIVNWSNFLAIPLTPYPNLQAYLARVSQRPQVNTIARSRPRPVASPAPSLLPSPPVSAVEL